MAEIKAVPLGAGQDVGRSCIIVTLGGKNIMLDCGMHMGYSDERKFPDFTYIAPAGPYTPYIDCLIISHFHLDHCGALPYFTEMCGYDGPIYMTHPTKAICPILLEDFRKIQVERKGDSHFFTSQNIKDCMKKVIPVNLHQCIQVDDELEIKAYYAGHVIGAAMFHCKVGQHSFVYTGDYNMTPDRHLGAAWIDKCRPDLLITESTYATTIRDSKRCREMDFLKKVHETILKGGKVLIPVFALGRAQELCILLETFWDRMNLKAPIYFSTGLTEKANHYYKLFISWTNQKIRNTFVQRNLFDFKHIKAFDRSYIENPGPMVVFATPGMLHAGLSLQIFKKWAPDENNMLIMPGYCVIGTVGHKVLSGQKKIELDKKTTVDVKLSVQYLSFSAHADAAGIMQLINLCEPKNVMLVHGEGGKMEFLKSKINEEFGLNCYMPANGESVSIPIQPKIIVDMAKGNITEVKQLMKEVKVDCIGDDGMTPLMYASYKGNELMVRLLIEHGADVNIDTQKDGYTPLMFAVFSGSTEVVRLLLEQGAKKDTVNKIKRTASQLGAFVGRHDCVSIINNFVDNEQINYYTRKQGLEEEAKLPEDLAGLVHKLVVIPVLNPVKLVLFIQENKKLIDNYKNVNKVLDCECSRAYKGVNEVLSLKVHVFQHVFEQCVQWEQGVKGKDGLKGFLKFLLRGRDEDGFPINMENLLRDSFKSFPHVQSNVFKQLIRTVSPVIPGNNPTALAALTQSINGIQSADFTECCSCCGERHAAQKCSACKMVRYCQGECQKLHWFTHKKFCKHLREQYMKLKEEEERLKKEEEERAKKEEKEKKAEVNNDTENKENEKHESNTSEQNT